MVSASDTSVMPTAATIRGPTSAHFVQGTEGVGTPRGSVPTVATPCACKSKIAETTVAATIPTRTAGTTLVNRDSTNKMANTPNPTRSAAPTVPSSPSTNALISGPKPSASVENPKSLGNWPTMMMRARPFM